LYFDKPTHCNAVATMASKKAEAVFSQKLPSFLTDRRQCQYPVKRFNKRDVTDFITAVIKEIYKCLVICLDSTLIGQKHISHKYDGRMSDQGIKGALGTKL
jgi:hypothetical protein